MSQYLTVADAESGECLYECGKQTLQALVELFDDDPPGFLVDHDLFGFDHSPYYDAKEDGVHRFLPTRDDVMADLDRLVARLSTVSDDQTIGALSAAAHREVFRGLKEEIQRRPDIQVTSFVWF